MFSEILGLVNKFIPDQNEAQRLAADLEKEMTKRMSMKHEIISKEQSNGSGKWRPRLMYMCMTIVAAHYIMYEVIPYIRTIFELNFYTPAPTESAHLWSFLKIGMGGYIGSRGVEKSIGLFSKK